jgi:CBS domain-containing protein
MKIVEMIEGRGVTVSKQTPVSEVLVRLLEMEHDAAAVLDEKGDFVAVIGIREVLRSIVPAHVYLDPKLAAMVHDGYFEEHFARIKDTPTSKLMDTSIEILTPASTVFKAVALIIENRRKTIPVVDGKKYLGMVTRKSLLTKVLTSLPASVNAKS